MNKRNRAEKKLNSRRMKVVDAELLLVLYPGDDAYCRTTNNAVRLKTNQPFFRKGGVQ
ncbi:hypothetical protein [Jeotgalibaca porci]|uniref:hypothetical protein n=1 Tax=Jeotgalibaca porci TaxID=1868793 RepID=UPI00359F5564